MQVVATQPWPYATGPPLGDRKQVFVHLAVSPSWGRWAEVAVGAPELL